MAVATPLALPRSSNAADFGPAYFAALPSAVISPKTSPRGHLIHAGEVAASRFERHADPDFFS